MKRQKSRSYDNFCAIIPKRKEHSNDLRSLVIKHFQNEGSPRQKHCFQEKRCGTSLTSTKELNALETRSIEAERR